MFLASLGIALGKQTKAPLVGGGVTLCGGGGGGWSIGEKFFS